MKIKELTFSYQIIENKSKLSKEDLELLEKAEAVREKAYAPYSKFKVGAALRLDNNMVFTGNNQENAAYPAGLCAERVAVFAAKSHYPKGIIQTVCITSSGSHSSQEHPISPCGMCRQVFAEYESIQQQPIRLILASEKGKIFIINRIQDLIPLTFYPSFLE